MTALLRPPVLGLALALPLSAGAATVEVGPGRAITTLADGIAAAGPGGEVRLDPGTYPAGVSIATDVTIRGVGPGESLLVGADAAVSIAGATVVLEDLAITGGRAGVEAVGGSLILRRVAVREVDASPARGAIVATGAEVVAEDLTLTDNGSFDGTGGGLVIDGGRFEGVDVVATGGWALSGAGARVAGAEWRCEGCRFTANLSVGDGGALHVSGGALVTLVDTVLFDNQAGAEGGGLHASGLAPAAPVLLLDGVELDNNRATDHGAALVRGGEVQSTGSLIRRHTTGLGSPGVGLEAGARWVGTGDVALDNRLPAAGTHGGAFDVSDAELELEGCTLSGNQAGLGGAIFANVTGAPRALALRGCELVGNVAFAGGALFTQAADLVLTDNLVRGGIAGSGGALHVHDAPSAVITGNTFCENRANTGSGGAVRADGLGRGGGLTWSNNGFVRNSAVGVGGAVFLEAVSGGPVPTVLRHDTYVDNTAAVGGAVYALSTGLGSVGSLYVGSAPTALDAQDPVLGEIAYNGFFGNAALTGAAVPLDGATQRFGDPLLLARDAPCDAIDLRVRFRSPLIHAGPPSPPDPDGSRADIGRTGGPLADPALYEDLDGDGFSAAYDCDGADPGVHPFARETCDGTDEDCDGVIDPPSSLGAPLWYADADQDGFGDRTSATPSCQGFSDAVGNPDDCDDGDPRRAPGLVEACDGVDNDCDALIDEGVALLTWPDADGDGHGAPGGAVAACELPEGRALSFDDCDDADPTAFPGADEVCDGADDDCDALVDEGLVGTWYADRDGDGHGNPARASTGCAAPAGYVGRGDDCRDEDPLSFPGAPERCDQRDNDCDGAVDEGSPEARPWFHDADGDGWGAGAATAPSCLPPPGFVAAAGDCDEADPTAFPGAEERCDGRDDDCDGAVDEDPVDGWAWFHDADGDGWGAGPATVACLAPAGAVPTDGDCDEGDDAIHPSAPESCDGLVDANCDGRLGPEDGDGDGLAACEDCDDRDPDVFPGAAEACDGRDGDCDGAVDAPDAAGARRWFPDRDGDGWGAGEPVLACEAPPGHAPADGDCDEADPAVSPGAAERWYDGVDQDCDGADDLDADGDGFAAAEHGGDDCDDRDPAVFPGAEEPPGADRVDQDCDGADGEVPPGCRWSGRGTGGTYGVLLLAPWWRRRRR